MLVATVVLADEPVQLKAVRRAPIKQLRDDDRSVISYLARGEVVSVLQLSNATYFVEARTATGTVRGWIDTNAVESPPAQFLEAAQDKREEATSFRELIDRREVAVGMSRKEVLASLGKPEKKSRMRTPAGDREVWVYITYRYLPTYNHSYDENGKPQRSVAYQRMPVGRKAVVFQGKEVVAISDELGGKFGPAVVPVTPKTPNLRN